VLHFASLIAIMVGFLLLGTIQCAILKLDLAFSFLSPLLMLLFWLSVSRVYVVVNGVVGWRVWVVAYRGQGIPVHSSCAQHEYQWMSEDHVRSGYTLLLGAGKQQGATNPT
jgi:hypothetical protein